MSNSLYLGLTSIGDLLINNRISYLSDSDKIQPKDGVSLRVPEYQRPYKWTSHNVNQLFEDLVDAMNANREQYRIGTLILHDTNDEDGKQVYDIVDGQQRVITLSLLLTCLRSNRDFEFLNTKLSFRGSGNIKRNYRTLSLQVSQLGNLKERLDDFIINHCQLIVVITGEVSEAFQFFDSQNARGKALYPHDLLKAYHLREMRNFDREETEKIVDNWENLNQEDLSSLFNDYLYRIKEWLNNRPSNKLDENNLDMFKGIVADDNYPFSIYYKSAYFSIDSFNNSSTPSIIGCSQLSPFQLKAPVLAGKPFFEYVEHYFNLLKDIQNNDKYEGYFINDNEIVKTLDLKEWRRKGDLISRTIFDSAILLYIDRFCQSPPAQADLDMLNRFVNIAFLWAYSLRAQYELLGWNSAKKYILGTSYKKNSFNIFIEIADAESPTLLLSRLADLIVPLSVSDIKKYDEKCLSNCIDGVFTHYLYHFKRLNYLENSNENKSTAP